jgi:hypothetical protein
LLEKKKNEEAMEILLKRLSGENIQKCICLAIKFEFADKFIN